MPHLSVQEVVRIDKEKKAQRKELYKVIYEQLSAKIRSAAAMGQKQIFLRVPAFLIGFPTYDVAAAARYIARQFDRGGFHVQQVNERDIYVSWSTKSNRSRSQTVDDEVDKVVDVPDLPDFLNLRKVADQYRKKKGA